ncbi:glycosyltransferase [Clostridium botulinum]|uniref:glycosyltransferase family 2 protein n=1 Tax=Clostridium botulinum TaxID=1491 RepID=UPI0013F0FB7C|nr:glycosyltransferase family 2 protein [Clostridium botulinum]MCS6103224.1 glycosyltransferase [Clostridium botulinum]MCS6106757.1 glycosyltransferase [Clostridium botulinum]NFO33676.1 glycosyltransferase [Clostridium botulinum]NFO47506.1 glycosyltransferase [Clostridium botulinum]NFS10803.1 glycosyltransferase [Clostridium botulinum]
MENDNIEVSVIVITYNQSEYIRQAIDSILMQKVNFKYEILVGDDASSDGTQEILKQYAEKYPQLFKLILRKDNVGATKNIYELLIKAKGKYLATLEGDDFWTYNNKLEEQYNLLEKNKQFIGCTHKFTIVNHNSISIKKQKLNWVKQKDIFTIDDFRGIVLPGQLSTWFFKNIFKENKYELISQVHRLISDRSIMMVILLNGDFKLINKNMGAYRSFVEFKNKTKCTNILYNKNYDKIKQEIDITKKNEQIALEYFNKRYEFLDYRRQIFFDSIIMFLRRPSIERICDIYNSWNYTKNKFVSILYIPINLFRKLYYRFY